MNATKEVGLCCIVQIKWLIFRFNATERKNYIINPKKLTPVLVFVLRNKGTETSKNERIPKTDGRSMKYRNTGNGIISTFVKLSFLSMSVMRQIW